VGGPAEIRALFQAGPEVVENIEPNLGRVLGPGSFFALRGAEHHAQRKLLVPSFHGRRLDAYERIVVRETRAEIARWPHGREFATLPAMRRITLNVILRAVFGAEGEDSARLRDLLPRMVGLGARLAALPPGFRGGGRFNPWRRFQELRAGYDAVVDRLLDAGERDAHLDERDDVLALLLRTRLGEIADGGAGAPMSRSRIADQLFTLLAAGHETTATTLAWGMERLRRHPGVLDELVAEIDAGGSTLRAATIMEVQRTRPVIDGVGRQVRAEYLRLGRWTLPRGTSVIASIGLLHSDDAVFPNARVFDPTRYLAGRPDSYEWIPFGGGARRCIGGGFAAMEMSVVLRTLLTELRLAPTTAPAERWCSLGVAAAPARGGRVLVHPRHPG
jgi:cytochrome P450